MGVSKIPLDNIRYNEYSAVMTGRLQDEIRQLRPFRSLEEEVYLNVLRTADALLREVELTLKPASLSPTQYNVLRILRGAGPAGLACCQISERMLTRDPDITRLLDRLESRGLVRRERERSDRRVVKTRITAEGSCILKELDEPMASLHRRQLRQLDARRLRLLVRLLEWARKGAPTGAN